MTTKEERVDLHCLEANQHLFRNVLHNPEHVLHELLPTASASTHSYSLRIRAHNRQLPDRLSHLVDCSLSHACCFISLSY